jgi:transaldolase
VSLYDQLAAMTVIVADTGELQAIAEARPVDATTNPSLILKAAQMDEYADLVDGVLRASRDAYGDDGAVSHAIDALAVEFGRRILELIPGRVSTEVDARLSFDTEATVEKARQIMALYADHGIGPDRVLIKIASTWEGIRAAEILENEGIHCNLTLLFGLHQAVACGDAGVTLISPFVGRILDWYKKDTGRDSYPPEDDPGVRSVTRIYRYYKSMGFKTEVMGASFRNLGQITELAGCDLLTISPAFIAELKATDGDLPRKLDPEASRDAEMTRITMTEDTFREMHQADRMASEKLAEGIEGFSKAIVSLEERLTARLSEL